MNKEYPKLSIECLGCGACSNICPANVISLELNSEGFYYPCVDVDKCLGCRACEKVCPDLNFSKQLLTKNSFNNSRPYASWALDDYVRKESSSGGVFSVLAQKVLKGGGVIYGAAWHSIEGKSHLKHLRIDSADELYRLRGSKYIQVEIGYAYRSVKDDLRNGLQVLFSGTPCQAAALRSYLKKDWDNLLIVDVACHGVPSRLLYEVYVKEQEDMTGKQISYVNFRDKTNGWSPYSVINHYCDGKSSGAQNFRQNSFMNGFISDIVMNEACYDCKWVKQPRVSDLTLADFWCLHLVHPRPSKEWKDNKGISLVLANTGKGEDYLLSCKSDLFLHKESWDAVKNTNAGIYRFPHFVSEITRKKSLNDLANGKELKEILTSFTYMESVKYDIGLLGLWWGRNYGAVFTSFALYKVLEKMGLSTALLDIAERDIDRNPETVFRKFLSEERVASVPTSRNNAYELNDRFKGFVVGSDLVWSHNYLSQFFFLDFVKGEKRRVGYSCSMSTYTESPKRYRKKVSQLLKRFDGVSYREENMVSYFKEQFDCNGTWVIDPVFLLSKEEWEVLAYKHEKDKTPHIAAYILDPTPQKENLLRDASERMMLPLEVILDMQRCDEQVADKLKLPGIQKEADLYQWLHNIASCDLFITDSYHGLCFALIFNKPFICLKNAQRGSARFESLLKLTGLEDYLMDDSIQNFEETNVKLIDWSKVNDRLRKRIDKSLQWLTKSLFEERAENLIQYILCSEGRLLYKPSRLREIRTRLRVTLSKIYHRIIK